MQSQIFEKAKAKWLTILNVIIINLVLAQDRQIENYKKRTTHRCTTDLWQRSAV